MSSVEKTLNIGSREAYIPALQDGSIDLIPEYTGVLAHYFDEGSTATESDAVYAELKAALPDTLAVLDKSEAEDKDCIAVTRETAEEYSLTSIADLAAVAERPHSRCRAGVEDALERGSRSREGVRRGVRGSFRALDAGGPLTVQALKNGQVDVANLFTTDPNIATNDFVVLEDPENLFAAENVVPLITKSKLNETISGALNDVSANLDTETLAALLERVVIDKEDAGDVASDFLSEHGLA